jgi:hypothetical protein
MRQIFLGVNDSVPGEMFPLSPAGNSNLLFFQAIWPFYVYLESKFISLNLNYTYFSVFQKAVLTKLTEIGEILKSKHQGIRDEISKSKELKCEENVCDSTFPLKDWNDIESQIKALEESPEYYKKKVLKSDRRNIFYS